MVDQTITPQMLVPLDLFADVMPLRIEVAYARDDNLLFGERIYRVDARLWLHKDLTKIVLLASHYLAVRHDLRFIVYDGLRTTDAQALMLKTQRVQDNLHWLEEPRLLSSPGGGGHPRGMAVDLSLETPDGALLDMGTSFDFLAENSSAAHNPAHRAFMGNDAVPAHSSVIVENRAILDSVLMDAADVLGLPFMPLAEEWWDFRLPPEATGQYAALCDSALPPQMRMTDLDSDTGVADFGDGYFEILKARLLSEIEPHLR